MRRRCLCWLSLLDIGELGKSEQDLMSLDKYLEGKVFAVFSCESESVKWAASFALLRRAALPQVDHVAAAQARLVQRRGSARWSSSAWPSSR